MLSVHGLNIRDATYVLANLRKEDKMELAGMMPVGTTSAEQTSMAVDTMRGPAYSVHFKDQPIAVFGLAITSIPTLYSAYAFGTNRFKRAAPVIASFAYEKMCHWLVENGALRLEIRAHAEHHSANAWLVKLGFHKDCELPYFGTSGETYIQYSATIKDYYARFPRSKEGLQ